MVIIQIVCIFGAVLSVTSNCVNIKNNKLSYELALENNSTDVTAIKVTTILINVTGDLFKDLPKLRHLYIVNNSVKILKDDCFQYLQRLHALDLKSNQITHIPRRVFSRSKISQLNLQSNKISEIDDFAFEDMSALSYLDLSNNFLTKIDRNWFKHSSIELIDLKNNRIVQIVTNTFSELPGLYYVDLSFNRILYIQDRSFSKCNGLAFLGLSGNGLTDTEFLSDTSIEELDLSLNKINKIVLSNSTIVKEISIYPNPLNCACLNQFWQIAKMHNIIIKSPSKVTVDWKSVYPVCFAGDGPSQKCPDTDELTPIHNWHFNAVNYENIAKIYKKGN